MIITTAGRVYQKGSLVGRVYYSVPSKCWCFRVSKFSTVGIDAKTLAELCTKLELKYEVPGCGSKAEAEAKKAR